MKASSTGVEQAVGALGRMTVGQLRTTVPRPPKEQAAGRTVTLAAPAKVTAHNRLPVPGTVLTRTYRGRRIEAKVLPAGFEYEGRVYRSLSAVAQAVTGSHWNGHLFFGLATLKWSNPNG